MARGPRARSPSRFQEPGGLACGKGGTVSGLGAQPWGLEAACPSPSTHFLGPALRGDTLLRRDSPTPGVGAGDRGVRRVGAAPLSRCVPGCGVSGAVSRGERSKVGRAVHTGGLLRGGGGLGREFRPCLPKRGPPTGQQRVEGSLLGGGQPMAALQILQHTGVRGHDAGRVHVAHQDPEEQQVRGAEPQAGSSLRDGRSA